MAARQSKSMREVSKYRRLLNRGIAVSEADDPLSIAELADEIISIKWHNPFWIGLVSLAVGNLLRKSAFTVVKRLGWTMIGYGAASTAKEGVEWAVDIGKQVVDIKDRFSGEQPPEPIKEGGGIGEP